MSASIEKRRAKTMDAMRRLCTKILTSMMMCVTISYWSARTSVARTLKELKRRNIIITARINSFSVLTLNSDVKFIYDDSF